ncbi:MAG: peptidoglycan-binding domain-containing protein, partial [Gammaproteobacteria bacterium]
LGISRSGGARNPHVFQYTLRFLRSGGTRPPFARDGFFTNSQVMAFQRSKGLDVDGVVGPKTAAALGI